MKINLNPKYFFLESLMCMAIFTSCVDLIEVDRPRSQLTRTTVFQDDLTAIAAVSGLYTGIPSGGFTSVNYLCGLSADELQVEQGNEQRQFFENEIFSSNSSIAVLWGDYTRINRANSIIEGLESGQITSALKTQLMGEAKFFRAFLHFYLVNLFGDIPYITKTDYKVNGRVSRMPISQVYQSIIADLLDAKALLAEDYSYSDGERVRVNKWVASSLLARVYLYQKDWVHAEEQATTVINRTALYDLNMNLNEVFLKNSSETIWQIVPNDQKYTTEGSLFTRVNHDPAIATLTDDLFNAFESDDDRKNAWIGIRNNGLDTWYHSLKYKENHLTGTGSEYYTVFRLGEQYLIRAEARAMQNKLTGSNSAESDINAIRHRAGLPNTTAKIQSEILAAVEHERRVELFVEWGHRWLDLKRTGRASVVLQSIKAEWDSQDELYPLPYTELQLNPNMSQNPGY